jgi:Ca-activated chloride channel homolog
LLFRGGADPATATLPTRRPPAEPNFALVLVLDISASMKGRSLDLAKQALCRAVETLGPRDLAGVVVFEDHSRWVAPLQQVADKKRIFEQIGTIEAAGGTQMYPAMERACLALCEAYADRKHIVVMTDGLSGPGDFHRLTKEIAAAGITMSMVGMGSEPSRALLENMAKTAKGHAYFCDDASALPTIIEVDTINAAKVSTAE